MFRSSTSGLVLVLFIARLVQAVEIPIPFSRITEAVASTDTVEAAPQVDYADCQPGMYVVKVLIKDGKANECLSPTTQATNPIVKVSMGKREGHTHVKTNRAPVWQEKISLGCQEATTPIEIVLGNDLTKQACVRWTLPDWMAGTSDTQSVVESPAVDAAAPAADASTAITEVPAAPDTVTIVEDFTTTPTTPGAGRRLQVLTSDYLDEAPRDDVTLSAKNANYKDGLEGTITTFALTTASPSIKKAGGTASFSITSRTKASLLNFEVEAYPYDPAQVAEPRSSTKESLVARLSEGSSPVALGVGVAVALLVVGGVLALWIRKWRQAAPSQAPVSARLSNINVNSTAKSPHPNVMYLGEESSPARNSPYKGFAGFSSNAV